MFLMSTFEKANQKQIFFVSTFLDYYKLLLDAQKNVLNAVVLFQKNVYISI